MVFGRLVRAEHYVGWVEGEVLELGVGSEVWGWFAGVSCVSGGDGAYPAYGAGDDAGFEGVEGEIVVCLAGLIEHCCGGGGIVCLEGLLFL